MSNIMEQSRQLNQLSISIADDSWVSRLKVMDESAGEMVGAERVSKPVMGCSRKYILTC
jgi:hypothetical protein